MTHRKEGYPPIRPEPSQRRVQRLYLAVTVKLMALVALGTFVVILLWSSAPPSAVKAYDTLPLSVAELTIGKPRVVNWSGRPVLIMRRDQAMLNNLPRVDNALVDPDSRHSSQPDATRNRHRSLHPEFLVVLLHGTLIGCPISYLPNHSPGVPVTPWYGGFHESCSAAWYDLAGRAYRHGGNSRNLVIPPYSQPSADKLVIGLVAEPK